MPRPDEIARARRPPKRLALIGFCAQAKAYGRTNLLARCLAAARFAERRPLAEKIAMRVEGNFTLFQDMRPAVMVVSHERSGTHFLMNALAACYGYVSEPWINLDYPQVNIHYTYPSDLGGYLRLVALRPIANVVKSHHPVDFFADELSKLPRYAILAICRNPVSVMLSLWRFYHRWPFEGPAVADPFVLARVEPSGGMLRFQKRQYANILQRWAGHVEGWLAAAEAPAGIMTVRYEDLESRYEQLMPTLSHLLGRLPQALVRPARDVNVVPGGPQDPTGCGPIDVEALEKLCRDEVGETMARLGY
jgi:Sulfotransferase domain